MLACSNIFYDLRLVWASKIQIFAAFPRDIGQLGDRLRRILLRRSSQSLRLGGLFAAQLKTIKKW